MIPFGYARLIPWFEALFDPLKNNAFSNGEAKRWILKDNNGKLLGRIAALRLE